MGEYSLHAVSSYMCKSGALLAICTDSYCMCSVPVSIYGAQTTSLECKLTPSRRGLLFGDIKLSRVRSYLARLACMEKLGAWTRSKFSFESSMLATYGGILERVVLFSTVHACLHDMPEGSGLKPHCTD